MGVGGLGIECNSWCERTDTNEIGFRRYDRACIRIWVYVPCWTSIVVMKCCVLNMMAAEELEHISVN